MGPLSGKQQREWAAFTAKKGRDDASWSAEERRKEELHQLKVAAEMAKVAQGVLQKDDTHKAKMEEIKGKPSDTTQVIGMMQAPLGRPTNPEAGPEAGPEDTVPAMLTPGEAVIPKEAAQNPKNKPIIEALVNEGREQQGFKKGTKKVKPKGVGGKGSRNSILPRIPSVNTRGYAQGTEEVKEAPLGKGMAEAARKLLKGRGRQVDEAIDQATKGYAAGTEEVTAQTMADREWANELARQARERSIREGTLEQLPKGFGQKGSDVDITPAPQPDDGKGIIRIRNDVNALEKEIPRAPIGYKSVLTNELERKKEVLREAHDPSLPSEVLRPTHSDIDIPEIQKVPNRTIDMSDRNWRARGYDQMTGRQEPSKITDIPPTEMRGRAYDVQSGMRDDLMSPRKDATNQDIPLKPLGTEEIVPPKVDNVDITREPIAPAELEKKVVDVLVDGEKQAILQSFMENRPTEDASEGEKRSFLERMIKSIYTSEGGDSLFNEKDLARFAVIAAGGLLTGGSIEGSLRYAARDVLTQADGRQAARAATRAEEAKNQRELAEQLDGRVAEYLAKNVPPEVRKQAMRLRAQPVGSMAEKIHRDRQVVQLLAGNVDHTKAGDNKLGDSKLGYVNGQPIRYYEDGKGNILVDTPEKLVPLARGTLLMSAPDYRAMKNEVESSIKAKVEPKLREKMGKKFHESYANKMAEDFSLLHDEMPHLTPKEFAVVVERAASNIRPNEDFTNMEESLRRAVYGEAVISVVPSGAKLFMLDNKERPSVGALAKLGTDIQSAVQEATAKAGQKVMISDIVAPAIAAWNKEIQGTDREKYYKNLSKVAKSAGEGAEYYGMSPFMIYLREQLQK